MAEPVKCLVCRFELRDAVSIFMELCQNCERELAPGIRLKLSRNRFYEELGEL